MSGLLHRHVAAVGIDAYGRGIAPLRSAVADARAVARALESGHGYQADHVLLDAGAGQAEILRVLEEDLAGKLGPESALVFYFAGHGIALGDGSEGPQGFLLPQDADPADEATWLSMDRLKKALWRLSCRHLLVVLDCCFAGSFRWASTRNFVPAGRPLYDSQLERYLLGTAWQVLTSASHDQHALDTAPGACNRRGTAGTEGHSPFAVALLRGLDGEADSSRARHDPDGVVTATELYQYVFEELVPPGGTAHQTPGLWPLKPESTGEFVFLSPRQETRTRPDPPLDDGHNPWPGLLAYTPDDAGLFFGRQRVVDELAKRLLDKSRPRFLAVVGASGTGKSSVVRAGLLPRLLEAWSVVTLERLHGDPRPLLRAAESRLAATTRSRKLLFIDQFEELYTGCPDAEARDGFLTALRRLVTGEDPVWLLVTLRSDFEPLLRTSEALADLLAAGRYLVPAPTLEELRETIEEPARARALYFEPPALIDDLVEEVASIPGALPLLSFALAEMYRHAAGRRRRDGATDRALTREDYEAVGGVVGALHRRADALLTEARRNHRVETIRRLALRMVSLQGGTVSRRRISAEELVYEDPAENERVEIVLDKLTRSRLVVRDEEYLEPAHDTLVQAWPTLAAWLADAAPDQPMLRAVWLDASAWKKGGRAEGYLWHEDPRLPQARALQGELNGLEREFVEASLWRRRKRRILWSGLTAVVVLFILGAALYSDWQRRRAERALGESRNRSLVLEARSYQESRLDLALLLSLELERRGEGWAAHRLLFEGLESSPRLERLLHGPAEVRDVAWNGDGRLAAGGEGSSLLVWDPADGTRGRPLPDPPGDIWSLAWSADGEWLAAGGDDGVRIWKAGVPDARPRRLGEGGEVYAVAWSRDGRTLAAAQADYSVRLWDVATGRIGEDLLGAEQMISAVAWSGDDRTVAAAGMDGKVRLWDAASGEAAGVTLSGPEEGLTSLAWSRDGSVLAAGGFDGTVLLWDPAAGRSLGRPLEGPGGAVTSVAWSGGGDSLAVAGADGRIVLWDAVLTRPRARRLNGQLFPSRSVAWSADSRRLASGSGSTVVLWSSEAGPRLGRRVDLDADEVRCLAVSRDGSVLAAEGRDPVRRDLTLRIWDGEKGKSVAVPVTGLGQRTAALALTAEGRILSAADLDRTVRRFEVATGIAVGRVRLDGENRLSSLAWSADGTRLAAGGRDGDVGVWDAKTGKRLSSWRRRHAGLVVTLAWSVDGEALASAGRDGTLRLWDVASGEQDGEPLARKTAVVRLAWSADGRILAAAGRDGRIRLWDVERREVFVELGGGHGDTISGLGWSGDAILLSVSLDGTLRRWDVDPASWRERACRVANRNLTAKEWEQFLPDSPYRLTCPDVASQEIEP